MKSARPMDFALGAALAVIVAIYLPLGLATEPVLIYVGGLTKIVALGTAGIVAAVASSRFHSGSAPRLAWGLVSAWLLLWLVAQSYLGFYQMILVEPSPFPSAADAFFVAGYLALIAGFAVLVRAYVASGLPVGSHRGRRTVALGVIVAGSVPVVAVMAPIVEAGGPPLELALNLAYPGLDLAALVPAAILLRIAFKLIGGAVFWVWVLAIGGFVAMAVGDILYAYFSMLGYGELESIIDLAYIVAYALVARGTVQQLRVS